jgi:hypothetical protein
MKKEKKNSEDPNPGLSLIGNALQVGASIGDLLNMSIAYLIDPSSTRDPKVSLEPYKKTITEKFKKQAEISAAEHQVKPHMSKAIEKLKDAALLLAGGYPEGDPMWELYYQDVEMTMAEFQALGKAVTSKLNGKDEVAKRETINWLTSAGFCITDVIYQMHPDLERVFALKLVQMISALRVQVASAKPLEEMKELRHALEYAKMLESRGVLFDANGDPQYTEKYHEIEKREHEERVKYYGNPSGKPEPGEPGNNSQEETGPGC